MIIRLLLLLLGAEFAQRRWRLIALFGLVWALLGVAVCVDALDGVVYFPIHLFGVVLALEGLVTLAAAWGGAGTMRRLRLVKAALFLTVGVLAVDPRMHDEVVLAVLFGLGFLVDAVLRIAAARVVRFPGWRWSLAGGVAELVFAIFILEPLPTHYAGTVAYCVGVWLVLTGTQMLRLAVTVGRVPRGSSLAVLLSRGRVGSALLPAVPAGGLPAGTGAPPLLVRVWTPTGSVDDARPMPLVDRYIAAVDRKGVISTGHAAVEVPGVLYASHYPAAEIDHSPTEFEGLLRATHDNDVPGKFQPSYPEEAAGWCEATTTVTFPRYDLDRLRAFWDAYRRDATYNLTYRNCSSTAAAALDVAVEGALGSARHTWWRVLRAVLHPELMAASHLRSRAEMMAWTPGLVLDYARAMSVLVDPPPLGWATIARWARYVGPARRRHVGLQERVRGARA